jgi:hypothetical protein
MTRKERPHSVRPLLCRGREGANHPATDSLRGGCATPARSRAEERVLTPPRRASAFHLPPGFKITQIRVDPNHI